MRKLSKLTKRGQMTWQIILLILAILGLVIAVIILFFFKGIGFNYISRFYDWIRYGGSF